jgi:hypothetical protein
MASDTPLLDKFNNKREEPPTDPAEKILFAVMADITGRHGLRQEWDQIDDDVQEELLQTNLENIRKVMT